MNREAEVDSGGGLSAKKTKNKPTYRIHLDTFYIGGVCMGFCIARPSKPFNE